jgi:hypothetical protein
MWEKSDLSFNKEIIVLTTSLGDEDKKVLIILKWLSNSQEIRNIKMIAIWKNNINALSYFFFLR